ncbi:nitrate ABC transporter ATP-binding protein [Mycobacterium sp. MS1601]|uniref:ABC transporter ATP-binding protein n=1 Tax=Mycobacterium sp. MS1601 TaxID=1936029 RepID=UPI000979055D|nr:ABC transporter ATP-binding protein [Mycobacterium sp. MS1601]AQA01909.1 nitrate ABC transporter ATP-binding protein [Mycobacterium sp. MS1601]
MSLHLKGISQQFDGVEALAPVDLDVQDGEFVCIVGPSGCGKSTIFNIVSGLLTPTSGTVTLDGKDIRGKSGHVGYMLQKDLLLPWRTVLENIVLGADITGRASRSDRAAAAQMAERYGLGAYLNHYPHALSGGMRQRVAVMRTLALDHPLMLLDEPFGALDSHTRLLMQQWLLQVWREQRKTIMFVTHDIDEALFLGDRVVVMTPRPGRVQEVIAIDLPRPRDIHMTTDPRYTELKSTVLDLIYGRAPEVA